jgi:hypothetical protein
MEDYKLPEVPEKIASLLGTSDDDMSVDHLFEEAIEDMPVSTTISSCPWRYLDFPRFVKERTAILECVGELEGSFDDLQDRQINTVKLKKLLLDLRSKATSSSTNFLRVLNMCLDALDNTRSELLEIEQIRKLAFVLKQMKESIDSDQVNELENILHRSGLKPTPRLEGLAEFYTS